MSEILHPSGLLTYVRAFVIALAFNVIAIYTEDYLSSFSHQRIFSIFDVDTGLKSISFALFVVWAFAILVSAVVWLLNRFKTLEVLDDQLVYRSGIFNTKSIIIPYIKINNLNVRRSFFQRLVGLGSLDLDTIAMGAVSVVHFDNLTNHGIELILKKSEIRFVNPK